MSRTAVTLMTQVFPPEFQAGANRVGALATALAEVSDLTVVTILPSYPSPQFHRENATLAGHDESLPYRVARTAEFHPHRGSFVVRALREVTMATRLAWNAYRSPGDVLVTTSPSIFVGLAGALVSVLRRTPLVVDLRDLTWEYVADDAGRTGSRPLLALSRLLRSAARLALKRAALVSVSNAGIRAAVEQFGIDGHHIIDAPNGVSSEILSDLAALAEPDRVPDEFVVTYAGALGYYQGLATLLDVAEALPDVRFRLVGDGPDRPALLAAVQARRIGNVSFPGYVDRDTLFKHYAESHILFAQLRDMPVLGRATFPSKPYEYMATGRPIVYAGTGITADFLNASNAALIAEPENAQSVAGAIRRLIENTTLRKELGDAGRKAAPHYRREKIMKGLAAAVVSAADH